MSPPDDGVYALVGLSERESVRAGLFVNARLRSIRLVLCATCVVGFLAALLIGDVFVAALMAMYVALIGTGLLTRVALQRRYRTSPFAGELIQYRFDGAGFAQAGNGFEVRYAWFRVQRVLENAEFFVFMMSGTTYLTVPKRCLAAGDDERLRQLVQPLVHPL